MNVYLVQTEYYGWVLAVFALRSNAEAWMLEHADDYPSENIRVVEIAVGDALKAPA